MASDRAETDIAGLFDDFVAAFGTFDGARIAQLFATPGVALRRDGNLKGFASAEDVRSYYQAALDGYRALGCRTCRYTQLEVQVLNAGTANATVTWDLVGADGGVALHWRQLYCLTRVGDAWRIYASAFVSAPGSGSP